MNTLTIAIFACLAAAAYSAPSVGVIVKGPSGVVTDAGAWGVGGHGGDWDDGRWDGGWDGGHGDGGYGDGGYGGWDDGRWDDGRYDGGWDGGHSNVVHGNGATLIGPGVGKAILAGPVVGGGGWGGGWGGALDGGWGGGHGGVVVKGPPTVPATIVGPAGKIVADGLWGPTAVWKKSW